MRTHMHLWTKLVLAVAGTVAAMGLWAARANAAAALWISAPNWSYSAAAASSPIGTVYFWGLSVGPASYSWANAYSVGGGGAAYAFAEASAGGLGGLGGVQVAGLADPYAGVGVDDYIDPSNSGGYPSSSPGSDPFSTPYAVGPTGITLPSESSSEMGGDDELEAFVYNGSTLDADLRSELGASSDSGSTLSGDVTDFADIMSDLGLIPLDTMPFDDPSSLSPLSFDENTSDIDVGLDNVVLVGIQNAESAPEPGSFVLLAGGMIGLGLLWCRRRQAA